MMITIIEEHKMVEGNIDIKTVKIEAEVLVKKEQITKGLQNSKNDKDEEYPTPANQEIYTATGKISINLANSIVLQNNKKTKQHLMWS